MRTSGARLTAPSSPKTQATLGVTTIGAPSTPEGGWRFHCDGTGRAHRWGSRRPTNPDGHS